MATIITYLSIDDLTFHLLQQLLCTGQLEAEPKAYSALLLCLRMHMCVVIGSRKFFLDMTQHLQFTLSLSMEL